MSDLVLLRLHSPCPADFYNERRIGNLCGGERVLDTSVRQVDETLRPDEYLKMAANMKIVEIWQVCTDINISIRRDHKVSFCSDIVLCINFSAALV